jgi:hypothetical protein
VLSDPVAAGKVGDDGGIDAVRGSEVEGVEGLELVFRIRRAQGLECAAEAEHGIPRLDHESGSKDVPGSGRR